MSPRSFPLPLTTLGLTAGAAPALLTTGCTPAVVGDWDLKELEIDGEDMSSYLDGYSYTYEYEGCTYTSSFSVGATLSITADKRELEGELDLASNYSVTDSCDPSENYTDVYSESYDADVEAGDDGAWEIEIDDLDWSLECTVDGDELSCEGDYDGDDIKLVFERG